MVSRELSQRPLQFHWANLVLRFWNTVVKRLGTLCHRAFIADLELALGGVTECWMGKDLAFLKSLGAEPPAGLRGDDLIAHYATVRLPVGSILKEFARRLDAWWECLDTLGDPRTFPSGSTGIKACRYLNCMGAPPHRGTRHKWLAHAEIAMPQRLHQMLMRFRCNMRTIMTKAPPLALARLQGSSPGYPKISAVSEIL
ncbi:hypothetical protein VOLCADRAFT_98034 [Volvox carteri f. nagariensis]|uniref:Uncharacterized protein n=1 Tax=Volvox carteri f. nagariensis TaxID=3068 RepID=D8UE99_VOLCA|nr:uncharacterized protein VOLCADRAFT_98034 [Volvox carteri f. nagariensis]EFJ41932.1 hypothetical protein VOLCADRAFT_98034 [Volvox carteri f. nagariensis]|eukprot:XP_002956969.1 hypothetical protein VOLCADRAFT_98034 [Volvox carteri f. nagariensis]